MFTLIIILCFGVVYCGPCRSVTGTLGECIAIKSCPPFHQLNRKRPFTDDDLNLLRQATCDRAQPKVCCPPEAEWPLISGATTRRPPNVITQEYTERAVTKPPTPQTTETTVEDVFRSTYGNCQPYIKPRSDHECCGVDTTAGGVEDRISGGEVSKVNQFPWLAVLEYEDPQLCGGSLISSRYVVTAAHCLRQSPKNVILSEYNITTSPIDIVYIDGEETRIMNVIIPVVRVVKHPQYRRGVEFSRNDIGLVKMARDAPFTARIFPVCLPKEDYTGFMQENELLTVAGFGLNGRLDNYVKRHVQIPYVLLKNCGPFAKFVTTTQICAGGKKNEDSCKGDSGGPLMSVDGDKIVLIGIVSYGLTDCGSDKAPAVHTSVFRYQDWIQSETT